MKLNKPDKDGLCTGAIETASEGRQIIKNLKKVMKKIAEQQTRCKDCGLPYREMGTDLVLPDQQWRVICPENCILCANCICKRIEQNKSATVLLAWVDRLNYETPQK